MTHLSALDAKQFSTTEGEHSARAQPVQNDEASGYFVSFLSELEHCRASRLDIATAIATGKRARIPVGSASPVPSRLSSSPARARYRARR